jgi:O-antigen ligase
MLTKQNIFANGNLISFLVALIPLSIILGNSAININVILICLWGLATYKFEIFRIEEKKYHYLIYLFFLYLILITLIKNIPILMVDGDIDMSGRNATIHTYKENIIKSFFFLRFLILFLVINKIIEKKDLNLNILFISCAFFAFFISFDILIQVIFGKNLVGYPITFRPSSFFGQEWVAGGFIQKFSLFFIIFIIALPRNNKKHLSSIILFIMFFYIILLTGNRMPLLLYFFSILVFFTIQKKIKEIFIFFLLAAIIVFSVFKFFPKSRMKSNIHLYFNDSKIILTQLFKSKHIKDEYGSFLVRDRGLYFLHFNSAIQIWKKDKVFGSGIKSFKLNCTPTKYDRNQLCNNHPHNYFLELLVDVGIVGLVIIYLIFIFCIFDFYKFYRYNSGINSRLHSLPFFLILLSEFFPIKSSGSFFTTSNAAIIFLILAILSGISNLSENKRK